MVVYDGKQEDRRVLQRDMGVGVGVGGEVRFNAIITHYDLIMRDAKFLRKIDWNYLIVDEGHRLKNHESVLSKTLVNG